MCRQHAMPAWHHHAAPPKPAAPASRALCTPSATQERASRIGATALAACTLLRTLHCPSIAAQHATPRSTQHTTQHTAQHATRHATHHTVDVGILRFQMANGKHTGLSAAPLTPPPPPAATKHAARQWVPSHIKELAKLHPI